jgi:hypothetical protein
LFIIVKNKAFSFSENVWAINTGLENNSNTKDKTVAKPNVYEDVAVCIFN